MLDQLSAAYQLGHPLLNAAKEFYRSYTASNALDLTQNAQKAYQNPYLAGYLQWKYPRANLLSVVGHTYPVAVYPAPQVQRNEADSVLVRPLSRTRQRDENLVPQSAKYRAIAHRLGLEAYDRPCFTMKRLENGERLGLRCELGSYLRALDTCDEFAWELLSNHEHLLGDSRTQFEQFDQRLPLRQALHGAVGDPVTDGSRRSAAIAASALIAFYDEKQLLFLFKRRSQSVAVHAGMAHVVPSFMFQPATADLDSEFSIFHNLCREYLEELFNRPEPEETEGDWQYFYSDTRLEYLRELLSNGGATLYLTGLAVNLLNLRPEVCLLLFITDPEWYVHHRRHRRSDQRFQFNDEWMRVVDMGHSAEKALARVSYCRDDADLLSKAGIRPWEIVPPGAAALWLGKKMLDGIL